MKRKVIVLAGMAFGDEGKGSFTDFFTDKEKSKILVKYSGGSQAGHTVVLEDGVSYKFSQLSSGMFEENAETYITENVVINLDGLICEVNEFARVNNSCSRNILERLHIHESGLVVTPYHKLINHLNECMGGGKRRGSVGTGVSEARFLSDNFDISSRFGELITSNRRSHSFKKLFDYTKKLYSNITPNMRKALPDNVIEMLDKEAKELLNEKALNVIARREYNHAIALYACMFRDYDDITSKSENIVFEGSQGILIDKDYGLKPNTTLCDTTNFFPKYMFKDEEVTYYGVIKSFYSRHGKGILPTESNSLRNHVVEIMPQMLTNENISFGWFDLVLFRYACKISSLDKVLMSGLDILSGLKTLKKCTCYEYRGAVDDIFEEIFEYKVVKGKIRIMDIKHIKDSRVSSYLKKCVPVYKYFEGWDENITKVKSFSKLPGTCKRYVKYIEKMSKTKLEYVSVGASRVSKIKVHEFVKAK